MMAVATRARSSERALRIAEGFELPLALVTEATAIVATRGAGKTSTSVVIVEEAFNAGVQVVALDRTGVYWGLRSNARGDGEGLPIYVLGGPHGDVPLESGAGKLIADLAVDTGHSFVLDLSDMSKGGAVRFAADFIEQLYDRKARARSTTLVVVDEAHFYAPQTPRGGFKGDSARLMGAMEDAVGLGRSRGLGIILTTQRTQALNKAVLDLIETMFVMRMLSPRARSAVKDWLGEKHEDDERGVLATLESLPTGTAWVWAPLRGVLEKVHVRRILTYDSYATPEPGVAASEPRARRELDLAALGARMADTVERAKENDPAELRRQIRELQAAVRTAESAVRTAEPVTVEVPVEVEVPVVDDEKLTLLVQTAQQALTVMESVAVLVEEVRAAVRPVKVAAGGAAGAPTRPLSPAPRRSPTSQVREPAPRPRPALERDGGDPTVTKPEQRVLDAMGWYEALGVMQQTRSQVAMVANYKSNSGGFGNLFTKLRGKGLIDYPGDGLVELTPEGRALATDPGLPTTNEEIQAAILSRLPAPQQKILRVLLASWPEPMTREEVAEATGYTASSGGFGNLFTKLHTGALIEYPSKGLVRALDVLFPLG